MQAGSSGRITASATAYSAVTFQVTLRRLIASSKKHLQLLGTGKSWPFGQRGFLQGSAFIEGRGEAGSGPQFALLIEWKLPQCAVIHSIFISQP
jgi:hypothetical protein